jgi:amidohydrolase
VILEALQAAIDTVIAPDIQKDIVALREHLHANPELSDNETQTQAKLYETLIGLGITDIKKVQTGMVARIPGKNPSALPVAIRGDIDALPITEATGLPFSSKNNGVMHACGHDVHASWAMGVAMLLSKQPAEADVYVVFQHAEELATGARQIIESGVLPKQLRAIVGGHVDRRYGVGEVVVHNGAIASFSDKFFVTLHGKSSHAARPEEGCNPIPALASCIQFITNMAASIGEESVKNIITITQVKGGDRHNIIPGSVSFTGTIRCLSPEVREQFHAGLKSMPLPDGIQADVEIKASAPAVFNTPELEPVVTDVIERVCGKNAAIPLYKLNLASEDFGHFANAYPAWFFRFGARYTNGEFIPVHTPDFYAETETVLVGTMVLSEVVRALAQQ